MGLKSESAPHSPSCGNFSPMGLGSAPHSVHCDLVMTKGWPGQTLTVLPPHAPGHSTFHSNSMGLGAHSKWGAWGKLPFWSSRLGWPCRQTTQHGMMLSLELHKNELGKFHYHSLFKGGSRSVYLSAQGFVATIKITN